MSKNSWNDLQDSRLAAIEESCKETSERLASIDKTLSVNTELLDIHIKRTNLLEEQMSEVKAHVIKAEFLTKALPWAIGIVSALTALYWRFYS